MKKFIVAVIALSVMSVQAQEAPKVTSAIIALRGSEFVEAKGFIDEASTIIEGKNQSEIKEKILSKFYYNKALIYLKIAASPDAEIQALAADANDIAAGSILDLIKFESTSSKPRYTDDAKNEVPNIAYNYLVAAGAAYESEDYESSYNGYISAYELKKNELGEQQEYQKDLLKN